MSAVAWVLLLAAWVALPRTSLVRGHEAVGGLTRGSLWPPNPAAKATVLQVGQRSYLERFRGHMESVAAFASAQGFGYRVVELSDGHAAKGEGATAASCVYTAKVRAIAEALASIPRGDWLVFLDLDIQRASCDAGLFPQLMPTQDGAGKSCHFLAQDSDHSVNTGFVAVEHSDAGAGLMAFWLAEQERLNVCAGAADQVALQSALLRMALPPPGARGAYGNECDPIAGEPRALHGANMCFAKTLAELGSSNSSGGGGGGGGGLGAAVSSIGAKGGYGHRSFQGVCLLGPGRRVNMHDGRDRFRPGDVFLHDKAASMATAPSCQAEALEQARRERRVRREQERQRLRAAALRQSGGGSSGGSSGGSNGGSSGGSGSGGSVEDRPPATVPAPGAGHPPSSALLLGGGGGGGGIGADVSGGPRRHNVTLIISAQRCGSNWISRMIRSLGVRPFGQESMLDFCTNSRSPKCAPPRVRVLAR